MSDKKVPELRFKGFTDDWEQRKLGELIIDISRPIKLEDEELYELVTVKRRNGGIVSRGKFKGKEVLVKSQFQLRTGDYLISKRQVVHGANGIVPKELNGAIVSNEYLVLHGNHFLHINYLAHLSKMPRMYKYFFLSSYGIDIEKLVFNVPDWKRRMINLPCVEEQRKMVNFLDSLDNLLSLQKRKLENWKELKKAYLQQMFPVDGGGVPRLRFANFDGNWSMKNLKGLIKHEIKGRAKAEMMGTASRYLETTYLNGGDVSYVDSIGDVELDDVLILWDGSQAGTVYHGFRGALGSTFKSFRPIDSGEFLYQSLKRNQQLIYDKYRTPNIPHVIKSFSDDFKIFIPLSDEQKMIGVLLKKLDVHINLQEQKIEKINLLKQSYLQKMLI